MTLLNDALNVALNDGLTNALNVALNDDTQ